MPHRVRARDGRSVSGKIRVDRTCAIRYTPVKQVRMSARCGVDARHFLRHLTASLLSYRMMLAER